MSSLFAALAAAGPDLTAVVVLCVCSLLAAFVLFKFLQSRAEIQRESYKVGGGAAGFVVIFLLLAKGYVNLHNGDLSAQVAQLKSEAVKLRGQLHADEIKIATEENEFSVQGTLEPSIPYATVVLAVKQTNPDPSGRFLLKKKGVDLRRDSVALYVVSPSVPTFNHQIFETDDVAHVSIKWKQ